MATRSSLLSLRRCFAGLADSSHKQMGLRSVSLALHMLGKNEERVAELVSKAEFHLPYAVAKGGR